MKRFIQILLLIFISSCQDDEFNLSDHTEKKLVVEGAFTNQFEYQYFTASWSVNIGEKKPDYIDDMIIEINGPGGLIMFNSVGNGRYESAIPLAGVPGANYEIGFIYENEIHQVNTIMPSPISIESYYLTPFNELADFHDNPNFNLIVSSNEEQYFRHEIYKMNLDSTLDTNWRMIDAPIYWIQPVLDSSSQVLHLSKPNIFNSEYYFEENEVLKIKIYALSQDIGEYLIKLKDFMNSESNGSQYLNPPYFYSNEAYGMGYGTVVDSTYVFF